MKCYSVFVSFSTCQQKYINQYIKNENKKKRSSGKLYMSYVMSYVWLYLQIIHDHRSQFIAHASGLKAHIPIVL